MEARTHKQRVEQGQRNMTPEQIAEAKNVRCKERNAQRKEQRRKEDEDRNKQWRALSPKEQLKRLPQGGAKKQRAKIEALLKMQ